MSDIKRCCKIHSSGFRLRAIYHSLSLCECFIACGPDFLKLKRHMEVANKGRWRRERNGGDRSLFCGRLSSSYFPFPGVPKRAVLLLKELFIDSPFFRGNLKVWFNSSHDLKKIKSNSRCD